MSRISRVNVDVTATTHGLESGMKRAEKSIEGFASRVDGMKSGLEKLRGAAALGAGGFGLTSSVTYAFETVDRVVSRIAEASNRASDAIEKLRTEGRPLSASGLTPTTAYSLASIGPQVRDLQQRGNLQAMADTFFGEGIRGQGARDVLSSSVSGLRGAAAGYGATLNQLASGRMVDALTARFSSPVDRGAKVSRMATDVGLAIAEAIAPDEQARTISATRSLLEAFGDSQFRHFVLGVGRGAR